MKKIFALVTVVLFAFSASADVLFEETFSTERGGTYIAKAKTSFGSAWPYASQWFTGYTDKDDNQVEGNQYDNEYTDVQSYTVTIRGKKLDGEETNSTVGLFFGANKEANQNWVKFIGALPEVPAAGAFLALQICSSEDEEAGDLAKFGVKVNESELTVPATTLEGKALTKVINIPLEAGQIDSLKMSLNNDTKAKFVSNIKIATEAQGIENIVLTKKAQKVVVNGNVYIIRDEKMYDITGAQVR